MTKLAFIEVNRVVADCSARFAHAEKTASDLFAPGSRDWTSAKWHTFFMSEHVAMDTLMPGAYDQLNTIEKDFEIIFLTSQPEYMREALYNWLAMRTIEVGRDLIMKPAPAQWDKTAKWKTVIIHTLAFAVRAKEVVVIDDVQASTRRSTPILNRFST